MRISKYLNVDFTKLPFVDFKKDIGRKLEHGIENKDTNVTDDGLLKTVKIALTHLNEYPNHYNKDYGLLVFEDFLKSKLK